MQQLAEKLRKQNNDRLNNLKQLHKDQMAKLLKQAETMTDAEKLLKVCILLHIFVIKIIHGPARHPVLHADMCKGG